MNQYFLDTHILIWWLAGDTRLSPKVKKILNQPEPNNPLLLSAISLWEVSMLVGQKRLELNEDLTTWLEKASSPPLVELVGITPKIASEINNFPDTFHKDPADRIIVASARLLKCQLITYDQNIIQSKLVSTLS